MTVASRYTTTDEYIAATGRMIRAAGRRVAEADPEQLAALNGLQGELERALLTGVAGQRASGIQWATIGRALGVTKEAVIQRWGRRLAA